MKDRLNGPVLAHGHLLDGPTQINRGPIRSAAAVRRRCSPAACRPGDARGGGTGNGGGTGKLQWRMTG